MDANLIEEKAQVLLMQFDGMNTNDVREVLFKAYSLAIEFSTLTISEVEPTLQLQHHE